MNKQFYGTALMLLVCVGMPCKAQSLGDLLKKAGETVQTLAGKNSTQMEGTWTYTGSCIELKSDDLLKKAGGTLATGTVEKKLDEQLAKAGITAGEMQYTFTADSTFTMTWGSNKKKNGTYSYDATTKKVALKYGKLLTLNASMNCTSTQMDLLFESDKLLKLITFLSSKSSNSTLKAISSLAESYDGMMLGFSMKKE